MYTERQPSINADNDPVVTQELIANETAAILTITLDEDIVSDGAILFPFDNAVLSDDGRAITDERIVKYRGRVQETLDIDVIGYADAVRKTRISSGKGESLAQRDIESDMALDQRVIVHGKGTIAGQ